MKRPCTSLKLFMGVIKNHKKNIDHNCSASKHITWIDSLKGIAIIMVILLHVGISGKEIYTWYYLGQSVPLFLFCSAFLLGNRNPKIMYDKSHIAKTAKRIFIPFFICTLIQVVIFLFIDIFLLDDRFLSIKSLIKGFIGGGGYGPGSYYPWLYFQFFLFIPIIKWINDRFNCIYKSFFFTALLCEAMELAFFFLADNFFAQYATYIWRLTFFRYSMMIWIGINYNEILRKKCFCIFAIFFSVILATIDIYFIDLHSYGWNGYHWYTCFYVIVIVVLLKKLDYPFLRIVGKYSWDIFLIQMAYFSIITSSTFNKIVEYIGFHNHIYSLYFAFSVVSIAAISYVIIMIKEKGL